MKLCALIVTYNRLDKLKFCWAATRLLDFNNIVIVNNASTDGTSEWLSTICDSRLTILNSDTNDGGAGGFYKGSEWICSNIHCDWVVFFDDDAYPDRNLIENFHNSVKDNIDAIATKVVDNEGIRCKMNIPWSEIPNTAKEIKNYIKNPQLYEVPENTRSKIKTFSFVGVFIKKSILAKTYKNIKADLFIYYDDLFYSWFLHKKNMEMVYEPSMIFHHDISQYTYSAMSPWKIYYLTRNLILSKYIFIDNAPFSTLSILLRLAKYLFLVQHSPEKILYLRFYAKGIFDGVRNKLKIRCNSDVI
jgi:GT2 family glycosyltransferase